jgi:PLP dependent protein
MPASKEHVLENLASVRSSIAEGADRAMRDPAEVQLVAAAKTVGAEPIRWVVEAGVHAIGQNYVSELRAVRAELTDVPIRWHYIGVLQSGTAHHVAGLADVVETVAGERAARRLAGRAARDGRVIDALIEVDLTGERSGVPPAEAAATARLVSSLHGLRLRGVMTLPPLGRTAEDARPWFVRLRELRDRLREDHPEVVELSMGMSSDFQVAVEEGATMVRVGTALFGPRAP